MCICLLFVACCCLLFVVCCLWVLLLCVVCGLLFVVGGVLVLWVRLHGTSYLHLRSHFDFAIFLHAVHDCVGGELAAEMSSVSAYP